MDRFYEDMPWDEALDMEQAARLNYELREDGRRILNPYGVATPGELLALVQGQALPPQPTYRHYLSAAILGATREMLRQQLGAQMSRLNGEGSGGVDTPGGFPWQPLLLAGALEKVCKPWLVGDTQVQRDALVLTLAGDIRLEVRILDPWAYDYHWQWADTEGGVDTCPNPGGAFLPESESPQGTAITPTLSRRWGPQGYVADDLTRAGDNPIANTRRLVEALVKLKGE